MLVFDSFAVLAWLNGEEPAAGSVQSLLDRSSDDEIDILISRINIGEIYYVVAKTRGDSPAETVRSQLDKVPVDFAPASDRRVRRAAELKVSSPVPYADAFAAGLALEYDATLVTGDPAFESIEERESLDVRWLDVEK